MRDRGEDVAHAAHEDAVVGTGSDHVETQSLVLSGQGRVLGHVAQRLAAGAAGGGDARYGSEVDGVVELTWNAEKVRQIEVAEPQAVDAVHRRDLLYRRKAALGFNLGDDEVARVRCLHGG